MLFKLQPNETVMAYDVSPRKGGSSSHTLKPYDLTALGYTGWKPEDLEHGSFVIMTNKRKLTMYGTGVIKEDELPPFFNFNIKYCQGIKYVIKKDS